jgi:hypothetical protein
VLLNIFKAKPPKMKIKRPIFPSIGTGKKSAVSRGNAHNPDLLISSRRLNWATKSRRCHCLVHGVAADDGYRWIIGSYCALNRAIPF